MVQYPQRLSGGNFVNIAICDDNADDLETVRRLLTEHFDKNGYVGDIHAFNSGEALLSAFKPGSFDAVFLDIYMGGMTGMETAEKMRQTDPDFALVFITTSEDFAIKAFSQRAIGYVTKPVKSDSIAAALLQCQSVFMKNARSIEVMSGRQSIRIPLARIYCIEVYGHEVLVHTRDGVITTNTPLGKIDTEMGRPFMRCHRSYLVNMNYIDEIREQDIVLISGMHVPMRHRNRMEIRDEYAGFISDRLFEGTGYE